METLRTAQQEPAVQPADRAPKHELKFVPYSSTIHSDFFVELERRILDEYKLDNRPRDIAGVLVPSSNEQIPPRLSLNRFSFTPDQMHAQLARSELPWHGTLLCQPSLDAFKQLDKNAALRSEGEKIWDAIRSGRALDMPSLLNRFVLLVHADVKTHRFVYWVGFPALSCGVEVDSAVQSLEALHALHGSSPEAVVAYVASLSTHPEGMPCVLQLPLLRQVSFSELRRNTHALVVAADSVPNGPNPGWAMRNLLALLGQIAPESTLVCWRGSPAASVVLHVSFISRVPADGLCPPVVGWEKNEHGKNGPRAIDLSSQMDPASLMASSVDLNLKLMRWRMLPSLDLSVISGCRVLLLGAGTLGCHVARNLMAWGVRTITFVDNGTIAFSNPVRQTLYTFKDACDSVKKAECAAHMIRAIFPSVNAAAHTLKIPMPGHAFEGGDDQMRATVRTLETLIDEHDVVYLLTDTRESRWLPTMLCAAKHKLVLNAALGFDTYLVMRHGVRDSTDPLGCYFCNDVVAPGDSMRDRTLDQQCTVTRPGVSAIASALAVELMVSLLQHPLRARAPADVGCPVSEPTSSPLGLIPHQIRGFLSHYQNMIITGRSFDKCTACSPLILDAYAANGVEFILQVLKNPAMLEDITGLTSMKKATETMTLDWDDEGDEDF
eukprot:gnl/Spiro4/26049_TR12982_c0_g1_i1.p1 gnl/Spiro4/26049_TR12982_c0_g1~~gnl/Spiro4/26049_TR12982_c0_g1_i1.p1  ORF type:complete len:674 (+),score=126.99 gnl/Spiro4/26049_TR12982_c0_g1_i1:30-2024(+)